MENKDKLISAKAFVDAHCAGCKYRDVDGICTEEFPICGSVQIVRDLPAAEENGGADNA